MMLPFVSMCFHISSQFSSMFVLSGVLIFDRSAQFR